MARTIDFNIQKKDRKALVTAIAEHAQLAPVYCGPPSFAYKIGAMTVDRDGILTVPCIEDEEIEVIGLLEFLTHKGFVAAFIAEDVNGDGDAEDESLESVPITVRLPLDGFTENAKDNLQRMLSAKGELIKKALGVNSIPVRFTDTEAVFPWFNLTVDPDDFQAYVHFITALADMAKNLKRATAKEKETDNEKYAFRCFLLRLGFIGTEFKAERKVLLRNLNGSSAFRTPKETEAAE